MFIFYLLCYVAVLKNLTYYAQFYAHFTYFIVPIFLCINYNLDI